MLTHQLSIIGANVYILLRGHAILKCGPVLDDPFASLELCNDPVVTAGLSSSHKAAPNFTN